MFHYMIYYGGWSLQELIMLPCGLRKYFFEKLKETKEEEAKQNKGDRSQSASGGNNALQDYNRYLGKNQ